MLESLNLTAELTGFRQQTIHLADMNSNLSDNRVLSLSNIFVVAPEQARSSTHRFRSIYHNVILKTHDVKEGWERLPLKTQIWCGMMDEEIAASNAFPTKVLRKLARTFGAEADDCDTDDDTPLVMMATLLNCLVSILESWIPDRFLENTFQRQHVTPFLENVFNSSSKIILREGETHLAYGPSSLMADIIGYYATTTGDHYDILSGEIKPPSKSSQGQLQSDFVKLGKELRSIIDRLIGAGVNKPTACGILIQGYDCSTFSMRLVSEGVYLFVEHGRIKLLQSPQGLSTVPSIMEHLMQLNNLLQQTIVSIDDVVASTNPVRPTLGWKRPSSGTPKRTNTLRK